MLNSPQLLGINSPVLGKRNSLTKPFRLDSLAERAFRQRESKLAIYQPTQPHILSLYPLLIQTSRLLSAASPDRLHHDTNQSKIGWDNWQAIDRSSDRDDFNYKVDRSRFNIEDQSSQSSELESPALDFFTTVLPTEFAEIDPQLDSLSTHPVEVEIPAPAKEPLLGTSGFATETSIDLNLDLPASPAPDLTQISRSVVGVASPSGEVASLQENRTAPNLASPPELILDRIVPNLLDPPTTINPVTVPNVTPALATPIVTQSAELSLAMPPLEQIATAESIAPDLGFPPGLPSEKISPNSFVEPFLQRIDLPTVNVDYPQPPEIATLQPPLEPISAAAENIASVMPLGIEPIHESISDTLPLDLADSPIINQPPSTDPAQRSGLFDELAIANIDVPALPSVLLPNLSPTTSPRSTDRDQIATAPNQIPLEIQSSQPLNPETAQLNLAADISNIDRDLDLSTQTETANLNIPESPSILPADFLPTNLLPASNPEQIVTSATSAEIEADLKSTQLLNADIFQLDRLDANPINQASSGLEQISTFADEPTPENLENPPIPIVKSSHTLSATALSSDPNLTIESSPTLSLDSPQLNIDRSLRENIPLELTEIISLEQENITEATKDFRSDNLLISPITDRSTINQAIADSPQNTNQLENISVGIDDNSADITIPAPIVGYATGGYVKDANHIDLQSIATSDTVSAMLTPGEFVINAKDAQKNLDLLTHINSGGEPAATLQNTEIQPSIIEPTSTSTDISPTSIQRKRNDSLISPSLQREISLQQLSPLTNPGLDPFQSSQTESSNSSPAYSSPSMVFRKPISSSQPQYIGTDMPDEWGSIEDLMNGGRHKSDTLSLDHSPQQHPPIQSRSSPIISPKYTSPTRGFADGGEVTPSDISTTIAPITHTIESPIANPQQQSKNNDPAELEILAREIYYRLRQRFEIERERHGSYSGNLAW